MPPKFTLRELTVGHLCKLRREAMAKPDPQHPKIKVHTFQWNADRPPKTWGEIEGDWQQEFIFLGLMKKVLGRKTVEISETFFDKKPKGPYYANRKDPHFYYCAFLASGFPGQIYWALGLLLRRSPLRSSQRCQYGLLGRRGSVDRLTLNVGRAKLGLMGYPSDGPILNIGPFGTS